MNKKIVLPEEVVSQVIEMYKEQPSLRRIQMTLNISQGVVKRTLFENGINLITDNRDKAVNRGFKPNLNAFTDFTDEKQLYYYGLLLADGNLHKNKVSIILKHCDAPILEPLAEYFGEGYMVQKKIIRGEDYARVSVSHYRITENLLKQGFEPAKSMKEKLPDFYDGSYDMRHFWRGFVDGDGTVRFSNNRRDIRLLGSKEIVNNFICFVEKYGNCNPRLAVKHPVTKDCYTIQYSGKDASEIAYILYSECTIALERKWIKAKELIEYRGINSTNFNVPSKRNSIGVCGVTEYNKNKKLLGYNVSWKDSVLNKQLRKAFTFKDHGEDALSIAIKFRQEMNELHYNKPN